MRERVGEFYRENRFWIGVFIFATIFDATSTSLAITKGGAVELNPLSRAFITPGRHLSTTLLLSTTPLIVLVLIFFFWAHPPRERYGKVLLEGAGVLQILAGINNTLIYLGYPTILGLFALVAGFSHYLTRLYIIGKERSGKTLLDHLKKPWN